MAFKLAHAFIKYGRENNLGGYATELQDILDFVALGTVADIVPLLGENRILVKYGMETLRKQLRPGSRALIEVARVGASLQPSDITFKLAPRINAAGRLGNANSALDLLNASNIVEAYRCADMLENFNQRRQAKEQEIFSEAKNQVESLPTFATSMTITAAGEGWHQGVIGIAASRLAEQFSLPAIMICLNGEQGKGSCRSYGGFNLYDALSACSEHLLGFGGHALAAGLTIAPEKIDDFRRAFAAYYHSHKPPEQPEVRCDLLIRDPALLSIENVRELDLLEPYGNGNLKPVFCLSDVELENVSDVGNGRHMRVRVRMGRSRFEGIFFSHSSESLGLREGDRVDLAFTPQINDYRGHVSVQLLLTGARKHSPGALCGEILNGQRESLWAAVDYCPERADFVRIWKERCGERPLPDSLQELIGLCPVGMAPESFCLCLMAFLEAGLLESESGIYGARRAKIEGKADLEATAIMRRLRFLK